ncbi:hypothetical protein WA026_003578 [Henosepilachna vigintioctopunctata]|uniref:Uncharacterized protein n=1 Tax=Henosepilachna vigintioctopunctata TaxID=420089 RepID=A0AAW1TIL2_9CUCU
MADTRTYEAEGRDLVLTFTFAPHSLSPVLPPKHPRQPGNSAWMRATQCGVGVRTCVVMVASGGGGAGAKRVQVVCATTRRHCPSPASPDVCSRRRKGQGCCAPAAPTH